MRCSKGCLLSAIKKKGDNQKKKGQGCGIKAEMQALVKEIFGGGTAQHSSFPNCWWTQADLGISILHPTGD